MQANGVKWQVFLSISIFFQKCQFCVKKKKWNFRKNVEFSIKCPLLLKLIIFFVKKKKCLFLEKSDILCESLYTLTNCLILVKNYNFFGYVSIFIKVFHLLEYCYFDSKYHILQWYFGQKCHFPSKIYYTCVMNSLHKLSNFLRKVLI